MSHVSLYEHQIKAVKEMKNGCILCGGVGSGKSRAALAYYYLLNDGSLASLEGTADYFTMSNPPKDLYIITTALKRDTLEWEGELSPFLLSTHREASLYSNKVVIDSWNNIGKYIDVSTAFFIFDEQRVVGHGAWVKSFLKITAKNEWILLSATPGDTWQDYIPVFIANGFYKNRSEFVRNHIVYNPRVKFPKIDRYINTGRLVRLRSNILIDMDFKRDTIPHHEDVYVRYDISKYRDIMRLRWNPWEDRPIENASELCYAMRKVVNTDESRQAAVCELLEKSPCAIIFYNFDYELEILKNLSYGEGAEIAEWNGHKHQPIPDSEHWVYLVQYNAGCEGWNCIKTDTIIFYSQNYSYKIMTQASGRIDRLNTPFKDLYYYHLKSKSGIDMAISKALKEKKDFNEGKFIGARTKPSEVKLKTDQEKIAELISRRRRQILVHSVIYYKMDENLISDATWSEWAKELEDLQAAYPEIAANQPYAKEFEGFDHSTGCTLPLDDPWAVNKARQLIQMERKKQTPVA